MLHVYMRYYYYINFFLSFSSYLNLHYKINNNNNYNYKKKQPPTAGGGPRDKRRKQG